MTDRDRHIFGWDLPPGVRSSDLPGNRPQDKEAEVFAEKLFEVLMGAYRIGLTREEFLQRCEAEWDEAAKEQDEEWKAEEAAESQLADREAELGERLSQADINLEEAEEE